MWKRSAKRLYDLGLPIYRLNQDDTETKIENPEMIDGDGFLYGIEKPDWKEFIKSKKGKSYLATRYEMCKSASTLVNEELSYFDEAIIVDFTVGRNKTAIAKYIQNQIEEDKLAEQLSMKEYIDPFTGEPTKGS